MRLAIVVATLAGLGFTLLLGSVRAVTRPTLADRLRPYLAGPDRGRGAPPAPSSWTETIGPVASQIGDQLARLLGPGDPLSVRLARLHRATDVATFRTRQLAGAVAGVLAGGLVATALRPTAPLVALCILGGPALGFLLPEHRLARATTKWSERLLLELPIVTEQLAMLLGAGYSLGAALARLGGRGTGAVAADLRRVGARVRQGLTEVEALREWSDLTGLLAVERLVQVLALDRETADLGRLVNDEARTMRAEAHRGLLEHIERRAQQVWVPVTVAALVPGVLFLAVPFLEAIRLFGG